MSKTDQTKATVAPSTRNQKHSDAMVSVCSFNRSLTTNCDKSNTIKANKMAIKSSINTSSSEVF